MIMKTLQIEVPEEVYDRVQRRVGLQGATVDEQVAAWFLANFADDKEVETPRDENASRADDRTAALKHELYTLSQQCGQENWDGYQAARIAPETIRQTAAVLDCLPPDSPLPTLGAEPDGHVTLEWYRSPQHSVSVSVGPDGNLHYAAILGLRKAYGTEPFSGRFPALLHDLIRGVAVV